MPSSEHGGREYAVGDVIGVRFFEVSDKGYLTPTTYSNFPWLPGENVAECHASMPKELRTPEYEKLGWQEQQKETKKWAQSHGIFECGSHGFYGLYANEWLGNYNHQKDTLVGVIRAYGEVQIGTKGFRAQKAEIIGASFEQQGDIWKLTGYAKDKLRRRYPSVMWFDYIGELVANFTIAREQDFADLPERELAEEEA